MSKITLKKIAALSSQPQISIAILLGIPLLCIAGLSTIHPILAIIISISGVTLSLFILKPVLPYYLLIILHHLGYFLFNFTIGQWEANFITISELYIVIIPFLWFFSRSINLAAPYPGTVCDMPLLLFVGLSLLSLLWTNDFFHGTVQMIILFFGLVVAFVVALSVINSHTRLNTVVWLMIIIGVFDSIICFFSIYSKYTYPDYTEIPLYDYKNFGLTLFFNFAGKRGHAFIHPLITAFFLNFALMLSFGKFITTKGNKKVAIGIIMFIMLTAHLTTLGKGPLLALIMGIVFLFYFIRPMRKVFFISISLLIITIIVSFIVGNIVELENSLRFTSHQMTGYDESSSTSTRISWWKISIEKSIESFGFGVGIGGIPKFLKPVAPHAHNAFIGAFGELGFLGLGLLLFIYFLAFKSYFKAFMECKSEYYKRILLTYIGGFITLVLTTFYSFNYTLDSAWWYLGLGFALIKLAEKAPAGFMDEKLPFFKDKESICGI